MTDSVETWSGKGRTDENFPVGSALIRPALRPHVHAFYAFARNADDIADSPVLTAPDKLRRLALMEAVLTGKADDDASPSTATMRRSLKETMVSAQHSLDLLAAFRQDATKRRYATWRELHDYCRLSAMPVGRHVLDLHGEAAATHAASDPLCAALQVLNHLQDGAKDLRALDRCYLPADALDAAGARVTDLAAPRETPALRRVFNRLLTEVDKLHDAAAALPGMVRDRRLRLEVAVILGLSRRLAQRLRDGDPVAKRVKLRRLDMVGSVLGAARFVRSGPG